MAAQCLPRLPFSSTAYLGTAKGLIRIIVHMYAILLYSSHSEDQDILSSPNTDRGGDERSPQPGLRMRKHTALSRLPVSPSPRLSRAQQPPPPQMDDYRMIPAFSVMQLATC